MPPLLKIEIVDYLVAQANKLLVGVYCEINHQTSSGGRRTVRGKYEGIENDKIVLEYNGRRNRIPTNMVYWWTYNIADQGGKIDG